MEYIGTLAVIAFVIYLIISIRDTSENKKKVDSQDIILRRKAIYKYHPEISKLISTQYRRERQMRKESENIPLFGMEDEFAYRDMVDDDKEINQKIVEILQDPKQQNQIKEMVLKYQKEIQDKKN